MVKIQYLLNGPWAKLRQFRGNHRRRLWELLTDLAVSEMIVGSHIWLEKMGRAAQSAFVIRISSCAGGHRSTAFVVDRLIAENIILLVGTDHLRTAKVLLAFK